MTERLTPENARLDRWMARQAQMETEIHDLRARLAAVLALCDEAILAEAGRAVKFRTEFALLARAAAAGDRAEPAEHRCTVEAMNDPDSDCWGPAGGAAGDDR